MSAGAIPSPNIWNTPELYEVENRAVDPDGLLVAAMRRIHDWAGQRVLDVGCGSGFHLPLFAVDAERVIGVEPHPPLVALARERMARAAGADAGAPAASPGRQRYAPVEVRQGVAQDLPVEDGSIDVAHARWAYFFGPGCEPGLAELDRVLAPGGTAYVIDNDATRSTFGAWFRRAWPTYDPVAVERFWRRHGWQRERIDMRWELRSREDFEAVVRIEFAPRVADVILGEHEGTGVDYAVNLWWRTKSRQHAGTGGS